jgi:hypothetical protein
MKRDSVVIYRNLYEALQGLSDKQYKRIMNAVLKYSMDGEESELSNIENAVFQMAKTQIDANNRKYENGKKGGEFGSLGGRPRKKKETEENEHQIESYDEIVNDMRFNPLVENKVKEFIKHCLANGHILINSELESILVQLDLHYEEDVDKIKALNEAIKFGYFGLKEPACS